ncbi:MAG: tRNA (guanine(10)-N(2))-dimethyltransferase [Candidatus Bathyarchaeota archaeon]|nr:MAG: tRNA (guanine(10)-N(2))-dimethyltransferase [Candidatus Bathyarchaeota archaeon]
MEFGFPTEKIQEGKTAIIVPKLSAYTKKASDYAPSKAPVFYNPVMELNRDFAVVALQAFQRMAERELYVSEPMTGCGLRGTRIAVEVEGIQKVVVNDINPLATKIAKYNAEINQVSKVFETATEDANLFLTKHAAPKQRFDYVDVDPFGTPVPYMDSALRSLRNGGMIALTATDMAPLCGVHPRACLRKYGGVPLRTEYCHELAVRLVSGCLVMMAAKHETGINVVFSHSNDHYVRVYATLKNGAKVSDNSIKQMGYILHCFSCLHREPSPGITASIKHACPNCGNKMNVAGPLWLGNIVDKKFCSSMVKEMEKRSFRQQKRLQKMLNLLQNEAEAPITYYRVDYICDKLNLPVPPQIKVLEKLNEKGYQAVLTHFNSRGFKTNTPSDKVTEIVTKLVT